MKKKSDQTKVLLAGDAYQDIYLFTHTEKDHKDASEIKSNWQLSRGTTLYKKPGGVLLIRHFLKDIKNSVIHLGNAKNADHLALKTYAILGKFKKEIRVKEFLGYEKSNRKEKMQLPEGINNFEIFCIDDANNGFSTLRESIEFFKDIKSDSSAVFYKLSWPAFNNENALLKLILSKEAKHLFVIVNASDLRDQNISISGRLSWEMAINDLVIKFNTVVKSEYPFFTPSVVIVRIGLEGVLVLRYTKPNNEFIPYRLFYIPSIPEDHFIRETQGSVQGLGSLFVSCLISSYYKKPVEDSVDFLESAIIPAMESCISFLLSGYSVENDDLRIPDMKHTVKTGVSAAAKGYEIRSVHVPRFEFLKQNPGNWSILQRESSFYTDYDIACEYVITGKSEVLANIPVVDYGGLRMIDRTEIEKYRSIKNLIGEYICNYENKKPLNLGVFGPPGSGKSFGVKQIAFAVLGKDAPVLEYNLSQFRSHDELIDAFHCIRDYTIAKKSPLVFFDEFDTTYEGTELGWLKYFLAPMQDGEFLDRGVKHPLGKAIFVFAGGTCYNFNQFSKCDKLSESEFRLLKVPDFISRLKGYVDILGINPGDLSDDLYIIRRAIMIRKNAERNYPHLIDSKGILYINRNILAALLMIPKYKHDSRSLNALFEMSTLTENSTFDICSLPPQDQIEIHTDSNFFRAILNSSDDMTSYLHDIAKALHNDYLKNQSSDQNSQPWDKLSEYYRKENIRLAENIPLKLFRLGLIIEKNCDSIKSYAFSDDEIEILARWEHKRWNQSKIKDGWRYNPARNEAGKLHDRLLPWESFSDDLKKSDRNSAKVIPGILNGVGLSVKKAEVTR
jgi:hypothetical protein